VRVSAKVDYAVRAAVELAAHEDDDKLVTSEEISDRQNIPHAFLTNILQSLRQAGVVVSKRGPVGGHKLAKAADEIVIADIIRAIDGPLAGVSGQHPEELDFSGTAAPLQQVWIAVRANLREILEKVTLADVANDDLPAAIEKRAASDDAWISR
jgi:Rrf2 family protein